MRGTCCSSHPDNKKGTWAQAQDSWLSGSALVLRPKRAVSSVVYDIPLMLTNPSKGLTYYYLPTLGQRFLFTTSTTQLYRLVLSSWAFSTSRPSDFRLPTCHGDTEMSAVSPHSVLSLNLELISLARLASHTTPGALLPSFSRC